MPTAPRTTPTPNALEPMVLTQTSIEKTPIEALDQLVGAVGLELDAVRARNRADEVRLTNGARVEEHAPGATYTFHHIAGRAPRDDERIVGEFDGASVQGTVVARGTGTLTLALEADLGPEIHEGRVMVDDAFLLVALRDRLRQLQAAEGVWNLAAVRVLTGERAPRVGIAEFEEGAAAGSPLNAGQRLAVQQALGSDVTLVWGPPGSGKSVVCERLIVDGFYAAGQSSLLAAPTNTAVDLVLARIIDRLARTGRLDDALAAGHIVRVGPISDTVLRERWGERISLDALVDARAEELAIERALLASDEERLWRELVALERGEPLQVRSIADDAHVASPQKLREALHDTRRQLAELDRRATDLRQKLIEGARIVATTCTRVILPRQVDRMFDAVVSDEAGMIKIAELCCVAARATQHVVVLGDFRQLGPIVVSDDPRVQKWVARDAFHAAGVVDALERDGEAPGLVALRVQHRSHPAIAALVNAVAYQHSPLETHPSVLARLDSGSPWGTDALLLIDTSPLRPFVQRSADGSRSNPVHASVVRWVLEELAAFDTIPTERKGPGGVLVLAPFVAQLALLRAHLRAELLGRALDLSTIHQAQGDERNTVILDLVDARGLALSHLLRATELSDTGARLAVVGATRARERLIVIGAVRHLVHHAPRGPVQDFVRYLSRHATRIELPQLLAHRALTFVERWDVQQRAHAQRPAGVARARRAADRGAR